MREEDLRVACNRRRRRGRGSYAGEVSKAPENIVSGNFHADAPDPLRLTGITEFGPWGRGGQKVYLSPVTDCFDGMPVEWSIGTRPGGELANSSLRKALARRREGVRTVLHGDRGGHYRSPARTDICDGAGLVGSMSAKGCSSDNSACEGFFGRLENEFFCYRDWRGVGVEEFVARLDANIVRYRDERIKHSLGWMSPAEYRRSKGYVV